MYNGILLAFLCFFTVARFAIPPKKNSLKKNYKKSGEINLNSISE